MIPSKQLSPYFLLDYFVMWVLMLLFTSGTQWPTVRSNDCRHQSTGLQNRSSTVVFLGRDKPPNPLMYIDPKTKPGISYSMSSLVPVLTRPLWVFNRLLFLVWTQPSSSDLEVQCTQQRSFIIWANYKHGCPGLNLAVAPSSLTLYIPLINVRWWIRSHGLNLVYFPSTGAKGATVYLHSFLSVFLLQPEDLSTSAYIFSPSSISNLYPKSFPLEKALLFIWLWEALNSLQGIILFMNKY